MHNLELLAGALKTETGNIFESSGEVVTVIANPHCLTLNYKNKSMRIREYPRHNFVQWDMPTGRPSGYVRVNSPAEAAIDLLRVLYRC